MEQLLDLTSLIISLDSTDTLFDSIKQIEKSGFSVIEINQASPETINKVLADHPNLRVGVGNVINLDELQSAQQSGAHFASSLGFMPSLLQTASLYEFPYLPGIATFSEAMLANSLGAKYARLFPENPDFCAYLNKHMPTLKLIPIEHVIPSATPVAI